MCITFGIVEKNNNRLVSIVDSSMKSYVSNNLPIFDIVEIISVGTASLGTEKGTIHAISASTIDNKYYYMISIYPKSLTLKQAYDLIK